MNKKWEKRGNETTIKEVFLRNIGVKDISEVTEWFKIYFERCYTLKALEDMVKLILDYKDKRITIVGDYDVDGQTSTSILMKALRWIGCKQISYRIPKRFSEGFGINDTIVDEIPDGLILTCDNGIAMVDPIRRAKEKGLAVGIIDHHEANADGILPPADVIIDPVAVPDSADFSGYCGAGLCYKVACRLLDYDPMLCQKLLPLAAIGTIADVMELREENYVIVRRGLQVIEKRNLLPIGLIALLSELKMAPKITSTDVGFKIGPCLNACSRMYDDGANYGISLMLYEGPYENVLTLARQIVDLNNRRKALQTKALNETLIELSQSGEDKKCPIVVNIRDLPEGLAGVVAGNLCERFKVPTIVVTESKVEPGLLRGSARSCGNYHMKNELDKVANLLVAYGGHEGAAGLSLCEEDFEELKERLRKNCKDFAVSESDVEYYDLEISASEIKDVADDLEQYEPFGMGNPSPVFKVNAFTVSPRDGVFKQIIGPEANIVKMQSNMGATAIGFDMADPMKFINQPKCLNLLGEVSKNYYQGKTQLYITPQVEFSDFENIEIAKSPLSAMLSGM